MEKTMKDISRTGKAVNWVRIASSLILCFQVSLAYSATLRDQTAVEARRVLTPADLTRIVEITDDIIWSSSGRLAFTMSRPLSSVRFPLHFSTRGNEKNDIWVTDSQFAKTERITDGLSDGYGSWSPHWSPDGSKIAFLSTRDGNVFLWLWDSKTREIRQLTDRAVNINADPAFTSLFSWISDQQLLCDVLGPGENPLQTDPYTRGPRLADDASQAAWANKMPAVSAIESGIVSKRRQNGEALLLIDLPTHTQRVLWQGRARNVSASPTGRYVSFDVPTEADLPVIDPAKPLTPGEDPLDCCRPYHTVVIDLSGRQVLPNQVAPEFSTTFIWSPDESQVAFLAGSNDSGGLTPRLFIGFPTNGTISEPNVCRRTIFDLIWTSQVLLVRCGELIRNPNSGDIEPGESRWVPVDSSPRLAKFHDLPIATADRLFVGRNGTEIAGIAGGKLWIFDLKTDRLASFLCSSRIVAIDEVLWPWATAESYNRVNRILVNAKNKDGTEGTYRIDLTSRTAELLSPPVEGAVFCSYTEAGDTAVFCSWTPSGKKAWLVHPADAAPQSLLGNQNDFFDEIVLGDWRSFDYRDLDGRSEIGWYLLPPGYQPGRRYPLVSYIYPGAVWSSTDKPDAVTFDLQLLAARGYVVLQPSMPLSTTDRPNEFHIAPNQPYNLGDLKTGLVPAIDKLIDKGLVDPEKLGVFGHSFGGWATYGIITQTNRFKAAVSYAGVSDLVSGYGAIPFADRYATDDTYNPETYIQPASGDPPWEFPEAYVNNSPIFYADRISTPVLMIHGDLDRIPIEQDEEMFTALHRLNKRCRFVRYWGEGHAFTIPVQIEDMWREIGDWFDEYLKEASSNTPVEK
jgi:dipeptidyl aminopeptidase/acylaminoacyl peptidase